MVIKKRNSFIFLNLAQFFTALNDNIYKLLLVFQLIALHGSANCNLFLSLAGAIFVLPFLIFASLAGSLADRFSKRSLIVRIRWVEIPIVSLGTLAFFLNSSVLGYVTLFFMATLSALFSPAKYGIIPEIVKKEEISSYNGILTATTYLAIILGTFFASFLTEITQRNFVAASFFCISIALLGALSSLGIERTPPQASDKKIATSFLKGILLTLKKARSIPHLLLTICTGAFFLFLGAYVQLNIVPFALQSLSLNEIQGGYLFLMTAIGIGIGSYIAGKVSGKKVKLIMIPWATFCIVIFLFIIYLFHAYFYVVAGALILLGMAGGFYIVPIEAFLQIASPLEDRGENIAAANFLNFVGVIMASILLYIGGTLLGLTARSGFLIVALIALFLAIFFFNHFKRSSIK